MVTGARASRSPVLPHPVAFSRTRLLVHYMIIFGSQLLTLHSLWAGRVERLADGNCICAGPNQIRFTDDALVLGQDMTLKAHQSRMASRGYASAAETVAVITFESDRKNSKDVCSAMRTPDTLFSEEFLRNLIISNLDLN